MFVHNKYMFLHNKIYLLFTSLRNPDLSEVFTIIVSILPKQKFKVTLKILDFSSKKVLKTFSFDILFV